MSQSKEKYKCYFSIYPEYVDFMGYLGGSGDNINQPAIVESHE